MHHPRYVMCDQARDTVREIMREGPPPAVLVSQPSWLALALLVVAFNLIAITAP